MHKRKIHSLITLACLRAAIAGGEPILIGDFTSGSLARWETESFEGETDYRVVQTDGRKALRAQCNDSASGLVFQENIDLTKIPVLHWS